MKENKQGSFYLLQWKIVGDCFGFCPFFCRDLRGHQENKVSMDKW